MKKRLLLVILIVQNTILSLVMLIFANVIISNAQINGELDYSQIRLFYNTAIITLFIIILIFAPILLSRSLNDLYKKNIIEHLLSVRIDISEIVYAVYFRGLTTLIIVLVSAFPIIVVSFYFGGFGIVKIFRLIGIMLSHAMLFSSICLLISASFIDENVSTLISYISGLILALINIYCMKYFLNSGLIFVVYILLNIIISLILVSISKKTEIFDAIN